MFSSFFIAGFECSTHRRPDGVRLDLLASTRHDRLAGVDYRQVRLLGMRTVRDGARWHLIERHAGRYDWSSWLPMVRAARVADVQVIWDLCHYGLPDYLDIWSAAFVEQFARYARAAAQLLRSESEAVPLYCPINEMSYWAWAGGEVARINPCATARGGELKRQLVRAYLAAVEAIRSVDPRARFIVAEPLINVVGEGEARAPAEIYRQSQFEVHDMLCGRLEPQLGGAPNSLDVVGANFYPHNQWYIGGDTIPLGHHAYKPFREMLVEVAQRYRRPMLLSETGAEGEARPYWLHHVCAETFHAMDAGVPVEGICIYPITDYEGWDNERLCRVGLLSSADPLGHRAVCTPLLRELQRHESFFRGAVASTESLTV